MNKLYIVCGAQGSGKSTWCKNQFGIHISRDDIRFKLLKGNEDYFSHEKEVFNLFVNRIQESIESNPITYADATHLNWKSRRKLLKALNLDGIQVGVIEILCAPHKCFERNNLREGLQKVPEEVIAKALIAYKSPKKDPYNYNEYVEVFTN